MANQSKATSSIDQKLRGCYGPQRKPGEVSAWVRRNIISNIERSEQGVPRIALNIWGLPGQGKTSVVKQMAGQMMRFTNSKGETKDMPMQVIDLPLAQIEEMGDVLGYPMAEVEFKGADGKTFWAYATDSVIKSNIEKGAELTGNRRTGYAKPEWAPTEECPGVILFDDGNRASGRILRGLMQLVQDYRTISWSIPKGWTIVFTGNPDNRYNQVTSMDTAQLTRMKHITLLFDKKEWANWAAQQNLDPRGINYVLKYPENVIGAERTNPRTLAEFFRAMKAYPSLFTGTGSDRAFDSKVFEELSLEAESCIDHETWESIHSFLLHDNDLVIEPLVILEKPDEAIARMKKLQDERRIDVLSISCDRLVAFIVSDAYENKKEHVPNFFKFMKKMNERTGDLLYQTLTFLQESNTLVKDKRIKFFYTDVNGKEMILEKPKSNFLLVFLQDEEFHKKIAEIRNPTDIEKELMGSK